MMFTAEMFISSWVILSINRALKIKIISKVLCDSLAITENTEVVKLGFFIFIFSS